MSAGPGEGGLGGRGILVTRPVARAANLCRLISAADGRPVLFPALEIVSIPDSLARLQKECSQNVIGDRAPDLIIFISPTAVAHGLAVLPPQWRAPAQFAAVGRATARALRASGVARVIAPGERSDSEALADLPQLQSLAGRRVLIVRGEGGREWLAQTLRERGAGVEYLECYRRVRPAADAAPLLARWRAGEVAAVTMTSGEALDNLVAMLGEPGLALLRATPMFASHESIAGQARALGIAPVLTTGAGDAEMVSGLQRFFATVTR